MNTETKKIKITIYSVVLAILVTTLSVIALSGNLTPENTFAKIIIIGTGLATIEFIVTAITKPTSW